MSDAFEIMLAVEEDGWTEWIHPMPGYLMKCCGCGLVHELHVAIGESASAGPANAGESLDGGVVILRMRREDGQ